MPRRPNIIPKHKLTLWVPEDLKARMDLKLFSSLEGKIPLGSYTDYFAQLLRQDLDWEVLDLSPFTGAQPGTQIIAGPPTSLQRLKELLV